LPIGLQIVGGHHKDREVLQAAMAFEQACPPRQLLQPRAG
jgi:Asp-tRNA(Asn)/Glu-tRNA(Gln) amidotransferase A subunit family amidase